MVKKEMQLVHKSRLTDLYNTSYIYELDNKRKILECCGEIIAFCTSSEAFILPKHPTDFEIDVIVEFLKQNNFEVMHKIKDMKQKYLYKGKRPSFVEVMNIIKQKNDLLS